MTNSGSNQNPKRPLIDVVREKAIAYIDNLSNGFEWHHRIGTFVTDHEIVIREYAPNAHFVSIIGDFNHWDRGRDPLRRISDSEWEVSINRQRVSPGSRYKLHIAGYNGARDRIPSTCPYARQSSNGDFAAIFDFDYLTPPTKPPTTSSSLKIYELHIGLAASGPRIGTYLEVAHEVVHRIREAGYTAVQLMAVHEHPYYGSFGYHVSNPYGICSRFGTRQDFKYLVDKCHELGLIVIIDLVHAHAVKNLAEGLGEFDGQEGYLFVRGKDALHPSWDSLVYDYENPITLSYLLSNARYWLDVYGVDGFRVDGVTSILYHDHGIGHSCFSEADYEGTNLNLSGLLYLYLLCKLVHQLRPDAVLIAEDVSGFPGVALPESLGGIGFDYRLQMGLPDFFESVASYVMTVGIQPSSMWHALVSRRFDEKHIGYVESHDQAIVGGQALIFRLLGPKIYTDMLVDTQSHDVRLAVAIVNVCKAVVYLLGGEAWMSFIGNEFGHPDWVEFPTPDNDDCFEYAYRKWYLPNDPVLMYGKLANFDRDLMHHSTLNGAWDESYLTAPLLDDSRNVAVFHRNGVVLVTNTSPVYSIEDLWVPVPTSGNYHVILSTDNSNYGGYARLDEHMLYPSGEVDGVSYIRIYAPSMSATLICPI
ncbi:MAG: alpha-amylase family glycosyl hydrolase [Armatimonadota bacterium]